MEFLKDPLYNATFSGILIYILIKISNKGDPVLGAILSSLPIGLFGLIAIGKIMGVINVIDTIGGGLGPIITAVIYDSTQNYLMPFLVISALLVIALISSSMLKIDDEAIEQNR